MDGLFNALDNSWITFVPNMKYAKYLQQIWPVLGIVFSTCVNSVFATELWNAY